MREIRTLWLAGLLGLVGSMDLAVASPSTLMALHDAADHESARSNAVRSEALTDAVLTQLRGHDDWRISLEAATVSAWRDDPATAASVWALQATPIRTGALRFLDIEVDPDVAPVLVERLLHDEGSSIERQALVDAIRRSETDWSAWMVGMLSVEQDVRVRTEMVSSLRYATPATAVEGLKIALGDADPEVRAMAATVAGWVTEAFVLTPQLMERLRDTEPPVRQAAARALGWPGHAPAWDALQTAMTDEDAGTRLHALRALERIDPARVASLPGLVALESDPDPRVARAALSLTRP